MEQPEPWADAVDLLRELSAPPFTADDLPPVLSNYPMAYAKATGFDPSLTISAAVSVAAAAIDDRIQICADSSTEWFQQARLWMLAIGRPGDAKSPTQKEMLRPLWELQRELRESHANECASLGEDDDKPPLPRVLIADTTVEALSEALQDNPRGLLIANDEFESWLGSLDTYRRGGVSRDRGEWLRAFDGGPHQVERVQRGSKFIPNWGVSILTATTPASLAKLTRSLPEDGLLQRFLTIVSARRTDPQPVPGIEALRERYRATIRRLYAARPMAHNGIVPMSFEARTFFTEWLRRSQLEAEAFGAIDTALESHVAKFPSFLLRLALTFHCAKVANLEHELARDPAAWPVDVETMRTAATFLKRAQKHAMAVYLTRSGGSEAFDVAREVARSILAKAPAAIAKRDLIQGVHAFRKAEPHAQEAALRVLTDTAWLRPLAGGYAKAGPTRFEVNPGLAARFQVIAERERERRRIIRDAITDAAVVRRTEAAP